MKCFPRLAAIAIATVSLGIVVGASGIFQAMTRTIPYDRTVPISERLVAGDANVVVAKAPTTPFVGMNTSRESLQEEIRRLSQYDTIALLQVLASDGELADGGTWVRTRVRGQATQLLKTGTLVAQSGFAEFWEDGGSTQLGSVVVTAGAYREFIVQQHYLVFLRTDRGRGNNYAALAFHVDTQGILEAMKRNDGSRIMSDSNLIGRSISEVTAAFSQAK